MAEKWQRVLFAPDVVVQVINDEALILKLQDEEVFALNETGARIARLITEGEPLERVIDILTGEYATNRTDVEREVSALVQTLLSKGLVVPWPGAQEE